MCYLPLQSHTSLARARATIRDLPRRLAAVISNPHLAEIVHEAARKKCDDALLHLIAADCDGDGDTPDSILIPEA